MRIMSTVAVGLFCTLAMLSSPACLAQDGVSTVATLNQNKASLVGQTIKVQGRVVKVNNGIMGRNFVHVQDGTGDPSTNNLIVTSKDTANVGDQVSISGVVVLNRDFGSGYAYPLLIEDASIAIKK
jgi:hypothetical protein